MTRTWSPRPGSLYAEESPGRSNSERLILLHGFTQTRHSWNSVIDHPNIDHHICRVDAPGHGLSPTFDESFATLADRLLETAGSGTYVGYSMGARICLQAAINDSGPSSNESVRRLILISGTPGIHDETERRQRRESDAVLARAIERDGVPTFLKSWLAQPMFANLVSDPAELEARLTNSAEGLSGSLRTCGVGQQDSLWDRLGELVVPILVIAGSRDAKFDDIGRRMTKAIGSNATFVSIDDAGHAAHLEKPHEVAAAITSWLVNAV